MTFPVPDYFVFLLSSGKATLYPFITFWLPRITRRLAQMLQHNKTVRHVLCSLQEKNFLSQDWTHQPKGIR